MRSLRNREVTNEEGQSLLEFALIAPVMFMLLLGLFDFGYVLFTYSQASFQLRDALRYGTLTKVRAEDGTLGDPHYLDCEGIADVASSVFFADEDVTVRYVNGINTAEVKPCWENGAVPEEVNDGHGHVDSEVLADWGDTKGHLLQVAITGTIDTLTPFLPDTLTFDLAGQRTIYLGTELTGSPDDTDADGLADAWETAHFGGLSYNATDDPDADRCNNGCEELRGTNPLDADTDGDGLSDGDEAYRYRTDPLDPDTDDDGLTDYEEVMGTHPSYPSHNYTSNPLLVHTDEDGLNDYAEIVELCDDIIGEDDDGDPILRCNAPPMNPDDTDTDGDGIWDYVEVNLLADPTNYADAPGGDSIGATVLSPAASPTMNCPPSMVGDGWVGLEWDQLSGVDGYHLYANKGGGYTRVGILSGEGTLSCGGSISSCFTENSSFYSDNWTITYYLRGYAGPGESPILGPASNAVTITCYNGDIVP